MIAPGAIPAALREHAAFAPYINSLERLGSRDLCARCDDQQSGVFPSPRGGGARGEGAANAADPVSSARSLTPTLSPGERESSRQGKDPLPSSPTDGAIPTFISPPARALSAIDFERRVVEQNELIVRPDSLHDVLNALVWLTFPKTKRAISEAHVALGVNADPKTRPRRRDVLTVFDESGMIVLSTRDDLREMNRSHQWRDLFVTHRADFIQQTRAILFGHGAMEQLGNQLPLTHRGLTVKALWLPLPVTTSTVNLDDYLAQRVRRGDRLHEAERTVPLPLLGIPGWFAENDAPKCYDDISVFRPKRSAKPIQL